jgi:ParB-like chromosome segregation protein Spo0J
MKVDLRLLKPNPFRPFDIDPLEEEAAEDIKQSIADTGFWGGIPVRKLKDGTLEIGAGHKRIYAAIKLGIFQADLPVKPYSDSDMVRLYATENATQRGTNIGLAMSGAIAAAVRYIIKGVLANDQSVGKYFPTVNGFETTRGQIASAKGLGHEVVLRFFEGIRPINESIVREHLGQLKASGDYARIVKEVHDEIAAEQRAEREALERAQKEAQEKKKAAEEAAKKATEAKATADKAAAKAAKEQSEKAADEAKQAQAKVKEHEAIQKTKEDSEKAVTASAKTPVTFDLKGVGKWLKTQTLLRTFRNVMTQESIRKALPVSRQADLAAWVVHRANTNNEGKLTANFIKDNVPDLIAGMSKKDLKLSEQQLAAIEYEAAQWKFTDTAHHFCRNTAGVMRDAKDMIDLKDEFPGLEFKVTRELLDAVRLVKPKLLELSRRLGI